MIITLIIFVASLAGCSAAQTYPQLMALRVLQSFGSGVCEAIPVQLVNEIVLDIINWANRSSSFMNVPTVSDFTQSRFVSDQPVHCMLGICSTLVIPGDCSSGSVWHLQALC